MARRTIHSASDLPDFRNVREVFSDVETTSGDDSQTSVNPWRHCDILGLGITVDDCPDTFYIPVNHRSPVVNVPREAVAAWLWDILDTCRDWINHNVKYDAHVIERFLFSYINKSMRWRMSPGFVDTLSLAKLVDSDRMTKGGYGLDALARDWLKRDISEYEQAFKPYLANSKDYSRIPIALMAPYACCDVETNRDLYKFIKQNLPEQCRNVASTEIEVTRVLWECEQSGLRIDPQQLALAEYEHLRRMAIIDEKLERLVGRPFRAHVSGDCLDVICGHFGLPVLKYNTDDETGEETSASFDKEALAAYRAHPDAQEGAIKETLDCIVDYRKLSQRRGLFLTPYQEYHLDGILHSTYNQIVRTGRMSCSEPNNQQLDKVTKQLILPLDGYTFWSKDYSQIEFRGIAHYIGNKFAIQTYNENPLADFHEMTGGNIGISRSSGKTMNFAVAFGMGKAKTLSRLASDADIVAAIKQHLGDKFSRDAFLLACTRKASHVYESWHAMFPELKPTARQAQTLARMRGYVFNIYGRRRHLPPQVAHIAFNTVIQSFAADLMKERLVAYWRDFARERRICIGAVVHDEILSQVPNEMANDLTEMRKALDILETPSVKLSVPIVCQIGVSNVNWREASKDSKFFSERAA